MAPIRSSITLVASEIAKALRGLSPEAQLAALSLAARAVTRGPLDADAPVEDAAETRSTTFLEEVRRLVEGLPPSGADKLRVVVKTSDGGGSLVFIGRHVGGRFVDYAVHCYASHDHRDVFRLLNRDVVEPLGLPPAPLLKKRMG